MQKNIRVFSSAMLTGGGFVTPSNREAALLEALAAVRAVSDETYRALSLAALAPHLPDTEREQALHDALTAALAIHSETTRAQALAALAPHLPDTLLLDALTAASVISDRIARAQSLAALAPHLPDTKREDSGRPSTPVREIATFFDQRGKDAQNRAHYGLYTSLIVGVILIILILIFSFSAEVTLGPLTLKNFADVTVSGLIINGGSSLIIRLGAVAVGIFLMQLLLNFVRYQTRMYFHWFMCAGLVRLSNGHYDTIKELADALMPTSIDFGKIPDSPTDKIIDTVAALAKKIPDKS